MDKEKLNALMKHAAGNRAEILRLLSVIAGAIGGTMRQRYVAADDLAQTAVEKMAQRLDEVIAGKRPRPKDAFAWFWVMGVNFAKNAITRERTRVGRFVPMPEEDVLSFRPPVPPPTRQVLAAGRAGGVRGGGDCIVIIDRRIRKLFDVALDVQTSLGDGPKVAFAIDVLQELRHELCGRYRKLEMPSLRYTQRRRIALDPN